MAKRQFQPSTPAAQSRGLGAALWDLIEAPQGNAFISDSVTDMSDADAIARAESALYWERVAVKKLAAFVRRHKIQ